MTTQQTVDHILKQIEAYIGRKPNYPLDICQLVTLATAAGFWVTHTNLQGAAEEGVVSLPEDSSHVSGKLFSEEDTRALLAYLEDNRQWSPLASQHDHKRNFEDLRSTRTLRRRILVIKGSCDNLNPVETLDTMLDESNPWHRYAMWLSLRPQLQILQQRLEQLEGRKEVK